MGVSGDSIRLNNTWFSITIIEEISLPNANGKPVTRYQVNGRQYVGIALALGIQAPAVGGAFFFARGVASRTPNLTLEERASKFLAIFSYTYISLASLAGWPLETLTRTKKLGDRRILVIT